MSAHGVAGPRSMVSEPATRGRPDQGEEPPDTTGQPAHSAPGSPGGPARPDHLRVVSREELSPRQRRRRARFAVAVTGLFVVAVLFGLVGLHVMLAQNQFRLDRLSGQADAEQARYERLRLQVDQLESPQRIVATAEQKLGMVTPSTVTYLTPSAPLPGSTSPATSTAPAQSTPPASSTRPARTGTARTGTARTSTAPAATVPAAIAPPDWPVVKPHLAAQP